MHFFITHRRGKIHQVALHTIAVQQPINHLVSLDEGKLAVLLEAQAGQTLPLSEYYQLVGIYEKRLLVIDGQGVEHRYPTNVVIIPLDAETIDFYHNQHNGKYRISGGKLVPSPNWQESTVTIAAAPVEALLLDA